MADLFLTGNNKPHELPQKHRGFWEFREYVEVELMNFGVPFEKVRVAVIDLKGLVIEHHTKKYTPKQSAVLMLDEVRRIYKVPM